MYILDNFERKKFLKLKVYVQLTKLELNHWYNWI